MAWKKILNLQKPAQKKSLSSKQFYTQIHTDGIKGEDKETENEFVFKLYFEMEYYMPLGSLFI